MTQETINCERCGTACKTGEPGNANARLLRRSQKGLCINCAVHDFLRNAPVVKDLLARSGPDVLLYPHIQAQFAAAMKIGLADANPDEINWQTVVDNWDLPFRTKVRIKDY